MQYGEIGIKFKDFYEIIGESERENLSMDIEIFNEERQLVIKNDKKEIIRVINFNEGKKIFEKKFKFKINNKNIADIDIYGNSQIISVRYFEK